MIRTISHAVLALFLVSVPASVLAQNAPASDPARTTGTVATDRPAGTSENRAFPDHAMVNMSKDQLRGLPEVRYTLPENW